MCKTKCGQQSECDNFIPRNKRRHLYGSTVCLLVAGLIHGPMNIFRVDQGDFINKWIPGMLEFLKESEPLYQVLRFGAPGLVFLASVLAVTMVIHACSQRSARFKWLRWPVFGLTLIGVAAGFFVGSIAFEALALIGGVFFLIASSFIPDNYIPQAANPEVPSPQALQAFQQGDTKGSDNLGFTENFTSTAVYSTGADYGKGYSFSQ